LAFSDFQNAKPLKADEKRIRKLIDVTALDDNFLWIWMQLRNVFNVIQITVLQVHTIIRVYKIFSMTLAEQKENAIYENEIAVALHRFFDYFTSRAT
jgi:hypothetical protein